MMTQIREASQLLRLSRVETSCYAPVCISKRHKQKSDEEVDDDDGELPRTKKAKKGTAAKKVGARRPLEEYTAQALGASETQQINDVMTSLASKSMAQLHAMLKKNPTVKKSGTKNEVLERIGECTVLGCLPKVSLLDICLLIRVI